jgi:hypothetical protein
MLRKQMSTFVLEQRGMSARRSATQGVEISQCREECLASHSRLMALSKKAFCSESIISCMVNVIQQC